MQVARDLVGLHSSDPATPHLSLWARVPDVTVGDIEDSLYEQRELLRLYGMRRTLWVVPRDVAEDMDAACTRKIAEEQRRRIIGYMERGGWHGDASAWLNEVQERVAVILDESSEPMTGRQLGEAVAEMRRKLTIGPGEVGMTTRVLFLMSTDGRITRARPRGSWISSQYAWAPFERWAGGAIPAKDRLAAIADLVARWLGSYGPGTLEDVVWWSGLGKREVSAALAQIDAEEVDLEGDIGYVIRGDPESESLADRSVALLPSLDPTVMGWKVRDWYLGPHAPALFDRNGNAGPTVWVDGHVVGGWIQGGDGRVLFRLLEPVDSEAEAMIEAEAQTLTDWFGDIVATPRFRTPLEKGLSER